MTMHLTTASAKPLAVLSCIIPLVLRRRILCVGSAPQAQPRSGQI